MKQESSLTMRVAKALIIMMLLGELGLRADQEPKRPTTTKSAAVSNTASAVERTRHLVEIVKKSSYAELEGVEVDVRPFNSDSDYFRTRFSIGRALTGARMHFIIEVNPAVYQREAPEEGIRAIIAHELGHVLYLHQRNRIRLLGLARLTSGSATARFERRTDLEAISRGYGSGLKLYREWIYRNVPSKDLAEKKRDYLSPEEIDIILRRIQQDPSVMKIWFKRVPLNIDDLRKGE
jgi:hypothetical protein